MLWLIATQGSLSSLPSECFVDVPGKERFEKRAQVMSARAKSLYTITIRYKCLSRRRKWLCFSLAHGVCWW